MSDGGATSESTGLALIEQGRDFLARAVDLKEVLDFHDKAEAVVHFTRRRDSAKEAHARAYELMERSGRRIGELCAAMPKDPRGRKQKVPSAVFPAVSGPPLESPGAEQKTKGEAIKDAGLTRQAAARFERKAQIPEDEHERRIAAGRDRILADKTPKDTTATTAASDYDSDEWGTPEKYLLAAREVLGGIDLDVASNAYAANVVKAERFYTKRDSALGKPWKARSVWMNPPYSKKLMAEFVKKFCSEWLAGHFKKAIVLTNSSTDVGWYHTLIDRCEALCLTDERIGFEIKGRPVDDNRVGQTLFYFGPDAELFAKVFGELGKILKPLRRPA